MTVRPARENSLLVGAKAAGVSLDSGTTAGVVWSREIDGAIVSRCLSFDEIEEMDLLLKNRLEHV
jgi:hypothetical protein